MSRGAVFIFLWIAIWPIVPADATPVDPFCRQLKSIIHDASQDFAAIRGDELRAVPDDGGGDSANRFAATRWLPGATTCGVDEARSDGDRIPSVYLCWFLAARSSTKAVERIARDVSDCIDPGSADRFPAKLDRPAFDLQGKGFVLSVTAERDQPVVLAISGK